MKAIQYIILAVCCILFGMLLGYFLDLVTEKGQCKVETRVIYITDSLTPKAIHELTGAVRELGEEVHRGNQLRENQHEENVELLQYLIYNYYMH